MTEQEIKTKKLQKIQNKINLGLGFLKIRETGEIITAKEHDRLTDKKTNPIDYEKWQNYNVDPFSKHCYKDLENEDDELELKDEYK